MAIEYGGVSGKLRVGIDVRVDAYDTNTPSINVYYDFYVRSEAWGFNDDQVLNVGGSRGGSFGYHMSSGSGQTVELYVGTLVIEGQGQNYGGGPVYSMSATVSGNSQGGAASHSRDFSLPARPPNVPGLPGIAGIDNITPTSARIVVTAADPRGAGIDAYTVRVHRVSDGAHMGDQGGGTTTFTNLSRATAYHAYANAHNGVGWSGWAGPAPFTTAATVPDPCGTPTASSIGATSAYISWGIPSDGGSGFTGWQLQVARDAGFTQLVYDGNIGYATVSGLLRNTRYYIRARAFNAVGAGGWSGTGFFDTVAAVPAAPTGLTATAVFPDGVNLSWVAPDNGGTPITNYLIQAATNASFTTGLTSQNSGTSLITGVGSLLPATTYYFRVFAQSLAGTGPASAVYSTVTTSSARVKKNNLWTNVRVWVKVAGVWKVPRTHKKKDGSWVI
jgi:hypothetical protein